MTHTVVGLFNNRSEAQTAMNELVKEGFIKEDIDFSRRSTAANTATNDTSSTGTTAGDSISNFFNSLFGDDETASNYTNAAYDADAILTVQVDSVERARKAAEILDRNGAFDVDEHNASSNQQNYTETAGSVDKTRNAANTSNVKDQTAIPVIEEQLQVGKREVERGGARIRSRIIEKPVEANVRLREEHVVVNRRPVDRAATQADLNNLQEGDIELTERAEVPVVGKQARVVEEIEVGKNVTERQETVRDTVKRTDVDVQEVKGVADKDDISHTNTRRAAK